MDSIGGLVRLMRWLDAKADGPLGTKTTIYAGNESREVVYLNVWMSGYVCVSVPLANYNREGKTENQVQEYVWNEAKSAYYKEITDDKNS